MEAERGVVAVIEREVAGMQRSDLFREPLVAFSDADDARYGQLKAMVGACPLAYLE